MCLFVIDVFFLFLVYFRYVVFYSFLDEIFIGKIKGCSSEGVYGNGGFVFLDEVWERVAGRWLGRFFISFCVGSRG